MTTQSPIETYRRVARCFKPLIIPENKEIEEILDLVRKDHELDRWYNLFARGKITQEEYYEAVEPLFGTREMDGYISEVDSNLNNLSCGLR